MNYGQGREAEGAQPGEVAAGGPGHDQDCCGKGCADMAASRFGRRTTIIAGAVVVLACLAALGSVLYRR